MTTNRERILVASRGQSADRLPFFHYWRHCQVGWAERQARNQGMGICWVRPPYAEVLHDVRVTEEYTILAGRPVVRRTYTTPLGSVTQAEYREPGTGQWHANRSWRDSTPWLVEHPIKGPADYAVMRFIAEHTEYQADYFPIEQADDWLGGEGIVLDSLPHSPLQTLLISWIGSDDNRFFYHLADYPDLVDELYQALCKARLPLYELAARSPAQVAMHGDNVDGWLISPRLFERYLMPVYEAEAAALHARGKLLAVHMDGRLASLKHLIARTPIDILDGFHPIPMGDLALAEALSLWPDKCIWLGFPGAVYALGGQAVQRFALDLLREAAPGNHLAIIMSTENLVSNANLLALTEVLAQAALPLSIERIARIAATLKEAR
ncbi:MAG: hypothetical protein LLG44_01640 [Chloroflexi bacterium]|nr:hypothetical protein [Chloroflexota bacterium]